MQNRSFSSMLLSAGLILVYPSVGMASTNVFEEYLEKGKPNKENVFVCPKTIGREKLLEILNAKCRKVLPNPESGSIPDLVAEPKEIELGLWAAHKMPDTIRLMNLINADKNELIYVKRVVEETRPQGTMGEKYKPFIVTYHFHKKDKPEDKKGSRLEGYSLVIAFYKEKPNLSE
ncbi:hypothetical protein IM40_06165 [Candidatus Paracaedimonas acanthamoebae]|nr:hypothetical protein IM40_06165 [Candidatus Paracaedimonas acanthamoebae]